MVFGGGLLVTVVTLIAMPQNRVVFGVLTCIGSCILIMNLIGKIGKKIPPESGIIISFVLFLSAKNINDGYLGLGKILVIEIPAEWYRNYFTTYLGLPFKGFYSTDYFSLFPWLFLFITGFYLYGIFEKQGLLEKRFMGINMVPFSFLGRHSLLIYLLHQPVIYGLQELLF